MADILKIEGNYLVITDNDTSARKLRQSRSNVVYRINEENKFFFYKADLNASLLYSGGTYLDFINYNTGVAFTSEQELIDFLSLDTGGFFFEPTTGRYSMLNSTYDPLGIGGTFIGQGELNGYQGVQVWVNTDQDGILHMEFSHDNVNWTDSDVQFPYQIGKFNPPQALQKGYRYYRTRFENTSGVAQTYLRLTTTYGAYTPLISTVNSLISQTYSATVVKPVDFNLLVSKNKFDGHFGIQKDGITDITTNGVATNDLTFTGLVYTGFPQTPIALPEIHIPAGSVVSGTVYYYYMADDTATEYTQGTLAVTGAGTYPIAHAIWRCNFMEFDSGSYGAINDANITLRDSAAATTIFCVIPANRGQSYCSAYTVPKSRSCFLDRVTGNLRRNASASADGFIWWREYNKSPRLRFPFILAQSLYFDDIDYTIPIPELTDFIPRLEYTSTNGITASVSYRILEVID